jgi:nucleoside-diphosphate-sugar epimerase
LTQIAFRSGLRTLSGMSDRALAGRRILLTGGTGFVGRTLLDHLQKVRHSDTQVVVLSRNPSEFVVRFPEYAGKPWLHFVKGDVLERIDGIGAISDVIHAAADTHETSDDIIWVEQIVTGTRRMLDLAVRFGASRFLFVSSGAIYGPQPASLACMSETYGGAPDTTLLSSTYGQAKRTAEQLCTIFQHRHGLNTLTARCFSFVGEHVPLHGPYAIGNFIADALDPDCSEIVVKGDGQTIRTYLDGEDMARWLLKILTCGTKGLAYNVGSSEPVTIADLASTVARVLAPGKLVRLLGKNGPDTARSIYIPCIRRMEDLGERPWWSLEESIGRAAAAIKSNGRMPTRKRQKL